MRPVGGVGPLSPSIAPLHSSQIHAFMIAGRVDCVDRVLSMGPEQGLTYHIHCVCYFSKGALGFETARSWITCTGAGFVLSRFRTGRKGRVLRLVVMGLRHSKALARKKAKQKERGRRGARPAPNG